MAASTLEELVVEDRAIFMPLSVEQYHRMIETGILPEGEPYELLDGYVVHKDRSAHGEDPMTVYPPHAYVVQMLAELGRELEPLGCHMRNQQPVALPPSDEPEPDGAIARGAIRDYTDRHPSPDDLLCVIEVADASLRRDRATKRRIYAAAGVAEYIIINLRECIAEHHTKPLPDESRYARTATLSDDQNIDLPTPGEQRLSVPLRQLLP